MPGPSPFLPPHLVRALASGARPPDHVERFAAALLLADVSGFTALTEKLQAQGRDGAEEVASLVGRALTPAVHAIERRGGSIQSFGGDALFAVFPGGGAVGRARGAADVIRRELEARGSLPTTAGPVTLGIAQAIHFGEVRGIHLGSGDVRHYLIAGAPVSTLARLQTRAVAGEILVSPAARARERREGRATPVRPCERASRARLTSYLPPSLRPLLASFPVGYRRIAVLFLETPGHRIETQKRFFASLRDVLERYEGLLLKSDLSATGTKWLSVFGIPAAHEDDVERAARAALELRAAVPGIRGGLHAGVVANVIVGTARRRCCDVIGDAVNSAARVLGLARWGELLATSDARSLLKGVETLDRGAHTVKGKSSALRVHALVRATGSVRSDAPAAPMVARDEELAALVAALERARSGKGAVTAVVGEAGIGKSRLAREASARARALGLAVHEGQASSFGAMAYWTIGALLKDALRLPELPGRDEVLAAVASAATETGIAGVDVDALADVLGAGASRGAEHLDGRDAHLNRLIAIRRFLTALAAAQPRLFILEDMHWADGASVEAAAWLARAAAGAGFVLLLLSRPGYEPPTEAHVLRLKELSGDAVDALLRGSIGRVPPALAALVRERAGGNPFYVEELAKHFREAGIIVPDDRGARLARDVRGEDLPGSIESVVAARLDRLSSHVRQVAQCGAVIGRSFLLELLGRLDEVAAHARRSADELAAREIVLATRRDADLEYVFKHAITRDVVYAGILASRRRELHRVVADALEQLFTADREAFLPALAHHREQSGQIAPARSAYLQAARHAAKRYALDEAEKLYGSYLRLAGPATSDDARARHELALHVLRVRGRMKEAEAEHRRALEEACSLGDRELEGEVLRGLGVLLRITGRPDESRAATERSIAIAVELGDLGGEANARSNLGTLERSIGRLEAARALYEQALALHRRVADRGNEAVTLNNLGIVERAQGHEELARTLQESALAIHRKMGDRKQQSIDLGNLALVHYRQGRVKDAEACFSESVALAREVGYRNGEGIALTNMAGVTRDRGQLDASHALYVNALAIAREVGDRGLEGSVLGNTGLLLRDMGRLRRARALMEQSLEVARETGNRRSEAEVSANLGLLHRDEGRMDAARASFEHALGIARQLSAPVMAASMLGYQAIWHLLAGDLTRAEALARESERVVQQEACDPAVGHAVCYCGHIAVAAGRSSRAHLARARRIRDSLELGPGSVLGASIAMLERAAAASNPLCGYAPEDVTPGQRRWLKRHRPSLFCAGELGTALTRAHRRRAARS